MRSIEAKPDLAQSIALLNLGVMGIHVEGRGGHTPFRLLKESRVFKESLQSLQLRLGAQNKKPCEKTVEL